MKQNLKIVISMDCFDWKMNYVNYGSNRTYFIFGTMKFHNC